MTFLLSIPHDVQSVFDGFLSRHYIRIDFHLILISLSIIKLSIFKDHARIPISTIVMQPNCAYAVSTFVADKPR